MTIEQERDIAVRALKFYADQKTNCPGAAARKALADITAIAAQASPVAQDERSELAKFQYWASCQTEPLTPIAAWQAGRASVAVPAMTVVKESLTTDNITHEFTIDTIANGLHYGETKQFEAWKSELSEYIRVEINRAMLASQTAAQPVGEAVAWEVEQYSPSAIDDGCWITEVIKSNPTGWDGFRNPRPLVYGDAAPPVAQDQDVVMLDWLENMANAPGGILLHDGGDFTGRSGLGLRRIGRSLREAINAVMQSKANP